MMIKMRAVVFVFFNPPSLITNKFIKKKRNIN